MELRRGIEAYGQKPRMQEGEKEEKGFIKEGRTFQDSIQSGSDMAQAKTFVTPSVLASCRFDINKILYAH